MKIRQTHENIWVAILREGSTLCAVLAFVATTFACSGNPHESIATAAERQCKRDTDCVVVDLGCGCHPGGFKVAVNAVGAQRLEAEPASPTLCNDQVSSDPTCSATRADCASDQCALEP